MASFATGPSMVRAVTFERTGGFVSLLLTPHGRVRGGTFHLITTEAILNLLLPVLWGVGEAIKGHRCDGHGVNQAAACIRCDRAGISPIGQVG